MTNYNILAICSALNNSYLALQTKDNIKSEIIKSDENYHSLYLISKIRDFKKDFDINSLDFITTNTGPGSFTGIRAALSTAKVMAGELNIPLVGLNSAEILLRAFNKKYLLMDARRDMYFFAQNDNDLIKIELIHKDKISQDIDYKNCITDERCYSIFPETTCYETKELDLGKTMLELAREKYLKTPDKDEFNYLRLEANYIQTPPVFT